VGPYELHAVVAHAFLESAWFRLLLGVKVISWFLKVLLFRIELVPLHLGGPNRDGEIICQQFQGDPRACQTYVKPTQSCWHKTVGDSFIDDHSTDAEVGLYTLKSGQAVARKAPGCFNS
jgi:hypothetical protein